MTFHQPHWLPVAIEEEQIPLQDSTQGRKSYTVAWNTETPLEVLSDSELDFEGFTADSLL